MNLSRGIIKSTKNILNDSDTKKVQLVVNSSYKLIESDEEVERGTAVIDERKSSKKRIRN